jgi:hypothetical protein
MMFFLLPSSKPDFSDAERLHALHEEHEAKSTTIDFVCQALVAFVDSDFLQAADQLFIADSSASHFGLEQIGSSFVPFFMHGWSRRFLDCGEHSTFGWINPQILIDDFALKETACREMLGGARRRSSRAARRENIPQLGFSESGRRRGRYDLYQTTRKLLACVFDYDLI